MNAKASARFLLGANQGRLRHGPPPGYAPISEARQPGQRLRLEPVFTFGQLEKSVFMGPLASPTPQQSVFVPQTVRTTHVGLAFSPILNGSFVLDIFSFPWLI